MLLRDYMKLNDLTVPVVMALCGVGIQSVYNWLSGNKPIPLHHAKLIQYYASSDAATRMKCGANIFDSPREESKSEVTNLSLQYTPEQIAEFRSSLNGATAPDGSPLPDYVIVDMMNIKINVK